MNQWGGVRLDWCWIPDERAHASNYRAWRVVAVECTTHGMNGADFDVNGVSWKVWNRKKIAQGLSSRSSSSNPSRVWVLNSIRLLIRGKVIWLHHDKQKKSISPFELIFPSSVSKVNSKTLFSFEVITELCGRRTMNHNFWPSTTLSTGLSAYRCESLKGSLDDEHENLHWRWVMQSKKPKINSRW